MNRIEGLRVVAGFVLAPGIGILVLMLWPCAEAAVAPVTYTTSCLPEASLLGLFGASIAYPVAFTFGLPLFIVFRIRGWLNLWQVAAGGILVALAAAALFSLTTGGMDVAFGLIFFSVGLAAALAFWVIAIFRNRALTAGSSADAPKAAHA